MEKIMFADRPVGTGEAPYIIAEVGSNHNGDIELARELIDAAHDCGAHAVKFQSWSNKTLISKAEYARNSDYADKDRHFGSLKEMVEKYQFTPEQHHEVAAYCQKLGIHFMSSAFSKAEVDLLASMETPAIKIASMDVTYPELLEYIGSSGKPVILSTGMATLAEIDMALDHLKAGGTNDVILLHCISIYPPHYEDIHLNNMPMLEKAFDCPVGFSDHTIGTAIPLAAVALGACMIEKHFTLDKSMEGWDHWISADPKEMELICREAKHIHEALGNSKRMVSKAEVEKRKKFRRCIVTAKAFEAGHVFEMNDFDYKRPGKGIHPHEASYVVGRTLKHNVEADHELEWADLV